MSGQMDKCCDCGAVVFYDDEKVIGTWNGEPNTRFDLLDFEHYKDGVPEGYSLYCLDCAPCECEFHPPFMSDRAATQQGWCFNPMSSMCGGILSAHKTDDHPCSHCFNPKFDCACSEEEVSK